MKRGSLCLAVLLAVAGACVLGSSMPGGPVQAAPAAKFADPGQTGPYAVGHVSMVLYDTTRPGTREGEATYDGVRRPIPVSLWYPVDPAIVAGQASDAVYPLDPLSDTAPLTSSADWEKYGIEPAFEAAVPSASKPFPLVVLSPGGSLPIWANTSTATRLASHGFVVAVMYHWGNGWWWWRNEPWDPGAVAAYHRPRVAFGSVGTGWRPLQWLTLKVQLDGHTSFYRDSDLSELGSDSVQAVMGGTLHFSERTALDIGVVEDLIIKTSPDVVFHFALRHRF